MLITKFNKMIRNRIVWWIIGGIVIITFVGWFSPHGGCEYQPGTGEAGKFNNEPVTEIELRAARVNTYLDFCMASGRKPSITPELDAILAEMAWKRVAALRMAKAMGIEPPSADELLAEIQRLTFFQENGAFSLPRYQGFQKNVLASLGFTVGQFENKLREDIMLMKVQSTTAAAAWISPAEFQRVVSRYADHLSIEYVTLHTNMVKAADVKLAAEDIKAYFDAHTNFFEIPAKVAVRYVTLPISNYLAKAVADSASVEEYYDTHTDEFSATDTNGAKVIRPLEDVRDAVSNQLIKSSATQAARDVATDLAVALAPTRDGTASDFEKVAAEFHLTLSTTDLFAADAPVPGIDSDIDFITAAFKLRPTPDDYFSDPVTGENFVYVLALATNTDAYVPEFQDVRTKVEPYAREKATEDALMKSAESIRRKFLEGIGSGEKFASLAKQQAMNVQTTGYFSAYSAPEDLSSAELLDPLTTLNQGEVSGVLSSTNGYIIAYMADRRPAADEDAGVVREQLSRGMIRRRARTLFSEWQDNILRAGRVLNRPVVDTAPIEE